MAPSADLVDSVTLERTVSELKKELEQHRQHEEELKNDLERKVNSLTQQVRLGWIKGLKPLVTHSG